jgi:hypothetical protein
MSLPAVVRRAFGLLAHAVLLAACATRQPGGAEVGTGEAEARLRREWVRAADAPPGLRAQLAASPIAFFRFVNHAWTHAVCDAFSADIAAMPTARLHGDAHVEQYAVTARTHGLDDFDDSAEGPALVDLVRFLGSLELVAGEKGWAASLPGTIDAFLDGYRRALEDIAYMPPEPAVARRLREVPMRAPDAFLSWAESLMQVPSADEWARLDGSWPGVEAFVAKANPEFTPAFMTRKAAGWLRLGIGSALTRKLLVRIEGPTPAPDDDLVLEAKEVVAFDRGSCVSIPAADEASRQVDGLRAMGRFPPRLLVALPGLSGTTPNGIGWWVVSVLVVIAPHPPGVPRAHRGPRARLAGRPGEVATLRLYFRLWTRDEGPAPCAGTPARHRPGRRRHGRLRHHQSRPEHARAAELGGGHRRARDAFARHAARHAPHDESRPGVTGGDG